MTIASAHVWLQLQHCPQQGQCHNGSACLTSLAYLCLPHCGTQDCAERLAREATALHFAPHVSSMDALDPTCLPQQRLVVMVAATTGQVRHPAWLQ